MTMFQHDFTNDEAKVDDITFTFKDKNPDRKWYQIWKPFRVDREITIHNANISIEFDEIDKKGSVIYKVTADTSHIAKSIEKAIDDTRTSKV